MLKVESRFPTRKSDPNADLLSQALLNACKPGIDPSDDYLPT